MKKEKDKRRFWLSYLLIVLILVIAGAVLIPLLIVFPRQRNTLGAGKENAVLILDTEVLEQTETEAPQPSATEIPTYDPSMTDYEGWVRSNGELYYLKKGGALIGLQILDGKYYYFDEHGVKAEALGVDVSTYSENIDWERVRRQGIDFAIVRLGGRGWTSGSIYGDLRCEGYLRGARKAGVKLGAYFYSTAINEAEAVQEADAVLRVLNGRALDLPVYVDVERSGEYPYGRADTLNAAERSRIASVFCERIRSAGYDAGVYSGRYYYSTSLLDEALGRYSVWIAHYTADRLPPQYERFFDIWQYTESGNVDGICCGTDMNVLFAWPKG